MDYTKKDYKVRVVPKLKKSQGDEGTETKVVYQRTSSPGEKSIKAGFGKSKFYHLEVFDAGTGRLGGDVKPFTITVFQNSEKLLFDALAEIEGEDDHTIMENSKVKVLKDTLPGVVRKRPCAPYYATKMNSESVEEKLLQSERQPDGNFKKMPVIMENVAYFLFENELNEDADNIKYANAVKRAMKNAVTATTGAEPTGSTDPDAEEDGKEG